MNRSGRPPLPPADRKSVILRVRVTPDEASAIRDLAKQLRAGGRSQREALIAAMAVYIQDRSLPT